MKIRNGFVSNSSSSSFIIAYKSGTLCPTCGHNSGDFMEIVRSRLDHTDNRISSEGYMDVRDEIINMFTDQVEWTDKTEKILKEELETILEIMNSLKSKGFNFASIGVSYHDEDLSQQLHQAANGNSLVILHSGGE